MYLEPLEKCCDVPYPEVDSEFEVQAFLHSHLKQLGLDVKGEVTVRGAFDTPHRKSACRFDLVVYRDKRATSIIEVKSAPIQHKRRSSGAPTRQEERYVCFGLPVRFVYGMDAAKSLLEKVDSGEIWL